MLRDLMVKILVFAFFDIITEYRVRSSVPILIET
jgi:hypothetical protein